ncbi:MAG: hypothetical protein Q7V61_05655 [Actinomycetota bacterium]|nr:hypothetical protein [Actinomycetota bacterium]
MKTYKADSARTAYDPIADVLFVGLIDAESTEIVDTPRGISVYYTYPDSKVAGVSVERYRRRWGMAESIEVDAVEPFVVNVDVGRQGRS